MHIAPCRQAWDARATWPARAALLALPAVLALGTLAGCSSAHYPVNAPLARIDTERGYRAQRFFATEPDDRFFVHLAVSGGGTRAAALGLGVLEALRDTPIRWQGREQRLLDQLDMLTGVSGGSMLAASVALHGIDGLPAFERAFLGAPLQSGLLSLALSPRSLWRVQSPRFGRGDLLAEFLDERLFQGATFAALSRAPRKPYTVIYASDMGTGGRFEFVQEQLDFLCADLDAIPLARAVAASSAVPLLLSPITLWNHAPADGGPGCGEPPLRLSMAAAAPSPGASAQLAQLETLRATGPDGLQRPFLHLLDGGLSDNVGARGPIDFAARHGSLIAGTRAAGYRGVRRMLFIVVNAETRANPPEDRSADVPGPLRAALALADIPINRNSATALAAKRAMVDGWRAEVAAAHARGDFEVFAADARFHLVEVALDDTPDAAQRQRLLAIPTTLQLPADDIAALRAHGAAALRRAPELRRLLQDLAETEAPPDPPKEAAPAAADADGRAPG